MKQPGWENRLIKYIGERMQKPFRPGELDCGLFAGGAVHVMTGENFIEPLAGKYRTIEDAYKLLNEMGHDDHVSYAASVFEEWDAPIFAQRGDLAVVNDAEGHPALGIVQGEHIYLMGLQGIGLAPLTAAVRAFKV